MKLMTTEILNRIPPLHGQEAKGDEAIIYVKFFNPAGAGTWYATEYDPEQRMFFGYVDLGMGPGCSELGYFSLDELEALRLPYGLTIERDLHFGIETKLSEVQA